MAAKNGFRSPLRYLCNSGENQVVKSLIEVKSQRKVFTKNKSFTSNGNLQLTVKLRRQILTFREVLDLPPVDGAILTPELLTTTVEDLYKMYPEIIQKLPISDIRGASTKQGLVYFCTALVSIGDSWTKNKEWRPNINSDLHDENEKISSEKLIGDVLLTLDRITKLAKAKFDIMNVEENDRNKSRAIDIVLKKRPNEICSGGSSPVSPTSVLPELPEMWNHDHFGGFFTSYTVNHTVPVKLQLVGTPNSTEVKNLPFYTFMGVEEKYPLHWLNNREADTPPAEKKVKLDLGVAVQGNRKNQHEMLEVDGGGNLTRLALQAPNQLLGKSISQPEFSAKALVKPAQTLKSTTEPLHGLTQISARPMPKPLLELPSIESTLPILPPPEFQNPSALQPLLLTSPHQSSNLLVPLPPPSPATHTEVLGDLKGLLPVPPLPPPAPTSMSGTQRTPPPPPPPPPSMISSILKGTPPLPPPSNLKAPPPPPPPSNLRGPPPPPLPMIPSNGSPLLPPMPPGHGGGAPPPPPSLGGRPFGLKATTKLKRSSHMGTLYRLLKGKVEGSSLNGKSTQGRKSQVGSGTSGKQGMADALAEITKRSAYFQQIEEDARKYAKTITELKSTITAFQTKDMTELVKFHKQVESQLENLTDESQVLTRFEGFPTKKLECLRMAAALYLKLNSIHTTIVNWKIVPPMSQLLVKVDAYFTKIKGEVDAIERTKDEELKKFKSHNIHFDFNILVKIKESMVDLSSGCMELALKESREAKSLFNGVNSPKKGSEGPAKMLWKAFQLAFRVYTFAGGQDDRADMLTKELAQEIETESDL